MHNKVIKKNILLWLLSCALFSNASNELIKQKEKNEIRDLHIIISPKQYKKKHQIQQLLTFLQKTINTYSKEKKLTFFGLSEVKQLKQKTFLNNDFDPFQFSLELEIIYDKIIQHLKDRINEEKEKKLKTNLQKTCTSLLQMTTFCINTERLEKRVLQAIKDCFLKNVSKKNHQAVIYFTDHLEPQKKTEFKTLLFTQATKKKIEEIYPYLDYFPKGEVFSSQYFTPIPPEILQSYLFPDQSQIFTSLKHLGSPGSGSYIASQFQKKAFF